MKLRKELAEKLRWAVEHSPCSAEYKGDITLEEREEIEDAALKYILSQYLWVAAESYI